MTDRPNKIVDGVLMPYDDADMAQMAIDSTTAAVVPVPNSITDWQFFTQLALDGDITMDDAKAYVGTGALPALFTGAIAQMPATATQSAQTVQDCATILIMGAHTFERNNPNTIFMGRLLGKTDAQLDAIWVAAAKL